MVKFYKNGSVVSCTGWPLIGANSCRPCRDGAPDWEKLGGWRAVSAILTGVGWCTAASNVAGMVKLGVVDVGASNHFGGFSEISTGCYSLTLIAHLWLTVGVGGIVRHIFGHRQYSIPAVYGYDGIQWTRHTGSTDYNSLFRFAMRLIPNAIEQLSSGASHPLVQAPHPCCGPPDRGAQRFLDTETMDSTAAPIRVKVRCFIFNL